MTDSAAFLVYPQVKKVRVVACFRVAPLQSIERRPPTASHGDGRRMGKRSPSALSRGQGPKNTFSAPPRLREQKAFRRSHGAAEARRRLIAASVSEVWRCVSIAASWQTSRATIPPQTSRTAAAFRAAPLGGYTKTITRTPRSLISTTSPRAWPRRRTPSANSVLPDTCLPRPFHSMTRAQPDIFTGMHLRSARNHRRQSAHHHQTNGPLKRGST